MVGRLPARTNSVRDDLSPAEITYVIGDATQPQGDDEGWRIIAHVCNDIGKWGSGFAAALEQRWPGLGASFRAIQPPLRIGAVTYTAVDDNLVVANMVAQRGVRSSTNPRPLDYAYLRHTLLELGDYAWAIGASIHMPRIGCGLAGGSWDHVGPLVAESLRGVRAVTVYDLPPVVR